LKSLDKETETRIRSSIKELESDPFVPRSGADIKKLHKVSKHEFYRLRVGNYRIVYFIEGEMIKVVKIFPRETGYGWLLE
jgi:mRNA-degrading endonuclease RelE of RelBE toxin-antitoxin system